ncbi:hypothetical protein KYC5002_46170 [Archangium violaceum]|uniref:hypothetical protein n=1 Tax=Archangium violaceum TaxID=83451 RepID=UPI002B2D7AAD|nr:hypothetical protein KYC5002_46170 [Archangium gephyra]
MTVSSPATRAHRAGWVRQVLEAESRDCAEARQARSSTLASTAPYFLRNAGLSRGVDAR